MLKGYVFGWSAPTYVDAVTFDRAAQAAGGYSRSYVHNYHAKRYLDEVRSLYRADNTELFLRKLQRDAGVARYAIVLEDRSVHPVQERVVVVFKLGAEVGVEYVAPGFVDENSLNRALNGVLSHVCTASVMASMVRHITDHGAIPLRKGGGAYFVPAQMQHVLDYVQQVVSILGGSVMKFGVTGLKFELETIFLAFRESFHMAVTELKRRMEEAKRDRTVQRLEDQFQGLLEIAEVYKDILVDYQTELEGIIHTAKRGIVQAISIDECTVLPNRSLFELEEIR